MTRPFVIVDDVSGDAIALSRDRDHHLRRVRRLVAGAELEVSDGRGTVREALLTPTGLEPTSPERTEAAPRPRLHVLQAVPKGGKLDDVVRELVELGVDRITPLVSERTVARPRTARDDRLRAVAHAAAEQSRRAWLPRVDDVREVAVAGATIAVGIVAHPGSLPLRDVFDPRWSQRDEVAIAIGPEGGWSDAEMGVWRGAGLEGASFGRTILRTEHAAAAAAAVLSYLLGRWDRVEVRREG